MTKIMKGGVAYNTTSNMVALTQAEYNSLSTAQKNNGNFYFITDADPSYFSAGNIDYDNTDSGLTATNVQDAIDELETAVSGKANKNIIETFTLTFASITGLVIHGQSCYYVPITGQVFINIDIYSNNNNIPNNGGVIATIPSTYRPSAERTVATFANIYDGSSVAKLEAIQPIGTNGEIKLHNYIYSGAINTLNMNFSYYV